MVDVQLDKTCQACVRISQGYCDGAESDDLIRPCEFYKRMTNADRIRTMTNNQLAFVLVRTGCPQGHSWRDCKGGECIACWRDWLTQEVI